MIRIMCRHCRVWDEDRRRWRFYFATVTDWVAPFGYNPRLKEFKCGNCGVSTFLVLTAEQLEESKYV